MKEKILLIALKKMSEAFNEFIGECMNSDGTAKAPGIRAIIKARGYLPPNSEYSLKKKEKKDES